MVIRNMSKLKTVSEIVEYVRKRLRVKISCTKIRGIGLIVWTGKYYAFWLEWADGGLAMPDGKLKPLWIRPRLRFVHT